MGGLAPASASGVPLLDVTPSIRSFAQAIDRQRQTLERVPLLQGSRADLVQVARALDEAEVAALAITAGENFGEAARTVSVPVLRADEIREEFRVYESRAAGADAVLLRASAVPRELLTRLAQAASSTHMTACIVCADVGEMEQAAQLRALIAVEDAALLAKAPPRTLLLALRDGPELRGRADAVLDANLSDPEAFRRTLED